MPYRNPIVNSAPRQLQGPFVPRNDSGSPSSVMLNGLDIATHKFGNGGGSKLLGGGGGVVVGSRRRAHSLYDAPVSISGVQNSAWPRSQPSMPSSADLNTVATWQSVM